MLISTTNDFNLLYSQKQISASILINILALGTGASFGIANVLFASITEDEISNVNGTNQVETNSSTKNGIWDFKVSSEEISWIGNLYKNMYPCKTLHFQK